MSNDRSKRFFEALGALAVHHGVELDKPTARSYYLALEDVPIDVLCKAFVRLLMHAGEFMPRSERIREVCDEVQQENDRREAQQIANPDRLALTGGTEQTAQPYFDCNVCGDTGMRPVCDGGCTSPDDCPFNKNRYCEKHRDGKASLPVAPCPCANTNPTILRRRKIMAANSSAPRYAKPRRRRPSFRRPYAED